MGSNDPKSETNTGLGMAAYATHSLFQPHRARQALRDAFDKKIPPLLCYFAGLASVPITRFLAPMGFDACWIDMEHSALNVETMTTMVHEIMFMSGGRTIPFVRTRGQDHATIGLALDAGASIIIPQVETVEEAAHVLSATKFGAARGGTRSAPPFRYLFGVTDKPWDASRDLHTNLNDQAAIMIQIESLKGVENLDDILTCVPGIDAVWLGTIDARISMGLPANGGFGDEPEWTAAVRRVRATARKHGIPFGGPCFQSGDALKKAAEDMDFILVSVDVIALAGMGQHLNAARDTLARR